MCTIFKGGILTDALLQFVRLPLLDCGAVREGEL